MHGFWRAAEHGLDRWAAAFPGDADAVSWPRRRRAGLFADARIRVIHTGVDTERFRPRGRRDALVAELGLDPVD